MSREEAHTSTVCWRAPLAILSAMRASDTSSRTPNWHRAKIAPLRVRMEGWRKRRLGQTKKWRKPWKEQKKTFDRDGPSHGTTWNFGAQVGRKFSPLAQTGHSHIAAAKFSPLVD